MATQRLKHCPASRSFDASCSIARYAANRGRESLVVIDNGPAAEPRYVVTAASMLDGTETIVFFTSNPFGGGKTDGMAADHVVHRLRIRDRVAYRRRGTGV